jgi:hypothetical protein
LFERTPEYSAPPVRLPNSLQLDAQGLYAISTIASQPLACIPDPELKDGEWRYEVRHRIRFNPSSSEWDTNRFDRVFLYSGAHSERFDAIKAQFEQQQLKAPLKQNQPDESVQELFFNTMHSTNNSDSPQNAQQSALGRAAVRFCSMGIKATGYGTNLLAIGSGIIAKQALENIARYACTKRAEPPVPPSAPTDPSIVLVRNAPSGTTINVKGVPAGGQVEIDFGRVPIIPSSSQPSQNLLARMMRPFHLPHPFPITIPPQGEPSASLQAEERPTALERQPIEVKEAVPTFLSQLGSRVAGEGLSLTREVGVQLLTTGAISALAFGAQHALRATPLGTITMITAPTLFRALPLLRQLPLHYFALSPARAVPLLLRR